MAEALEQSVEQILNLQLQQNPGLPPYKGVLVRFFKKHMSYGSLKPEMIQLYANTFSAAELREINQFYATETGKKTIKQMPALMAQGGQIGASRVQENMSELQTMIRAEAERL